MDLRGPGIILLLFLCCFLFEKIGNVTPTIDFKNKFEYIPIITANIYADLLIIFLTFTGLLYNSTTLISWYKKYRLSAMIGDIVIGILYIVAARYLVSIFQWNIGLTIFALLSVVVQIIGDLAFYAFFSSLPKGANHMLDFFKEYATEVKENALYGDSALVIVAVILSGILNKKSFDFNMVALIVSVYLIPYFIYMKD
jgi:hypothetical protein